MNTDQALRKAKSGYIMTYVIAKARVSKAKY